MEEGLDLLDPRQCSGRVDGVDKSHGHESDPLTPGTRTDHELTSECSIEESIFHFQMAI